MKQEIFILDSFALMAFFHNESSAAFVGSLVKKAQHKECFLKLSLINWGEVYYNIFRTHGEVAAREFLNFMDQLPIELVEIDRNLIFEAAQLKAKYRIAYADCFAAALAKREQVAVITGDQEFKVLASEIKIHWI